MESFDLLNAPLEGINLIEASAGTGKTYNIEGLFIRLLLEMQLQVDQILVLTFTNAATEELKDRIRRKLVQAKDAFAGASSDDPLITGLVQKYPDAKAAGLRLHEALIDFDKAAIFTIHGFCQRVLHENAFETRNLFDTELITDQTHLIQEVVDDFWRKTFYQAPLEFIGFALKRINGPQYFYRLLGGLKTPDVKIVPDLAEPTLNTLTFYRSSLSTVKKAWPGSRQAVIQALTAPALNANIYGSLKPAKNLPGLTQRDLRVTVLVEAMDNLVDPISIGFPLFKNFERFTTAKLLKSTKKNYTPPEHEFFDLCDDLLKQEAQLNTELETYLVFLKGQIFAFAVTELQKKKKEQNVQYFDDLLITLINALQTKSGDVLGQVIRQNYKAALVDEFQDTDNTQYQILTRLFSHRSSLLFMIGDPKQAIYSFRGADIFSYMQAARSAAAKFTLTENWRSQPGLITAVNTIFGNNQAPFVFEEIPFAAGKAARQAANQNPSSNPPLILWYLAAGRFSTDDKLINKGDAIQLIAEAVGAEISQLLSDSPPVAPGDIAVLVRTNDQAQLIKNILSSRYIPSVLYSTGNLFDSNEALEIQRVLAGIADPGDPGLLRASLTTEVMGIGGEALNQLIENELEWETWLVKFKNYHELWKRRGLMRMFRELLLEEKVLARLMAYPDGERRNTNVLHLLEVLHNISMEKKLDMAGLIKWLSEQRDASSPRLEEHQLRLESDENAVKLATIHKCKGLEYPIVFCPFLWDGSKIRRSKEPFLFHDQGDNMRLTFELGSSGMDVNRVSAERERLAENMRLFYVALTRAMTRCYFVWGRINEAETSAPSYLMVHQTSDRDGDNVVQVAEENFNRLSDGDLYRAVEVIAGNSGRAIKLSEMPEADGQRRTPFQEESAALDRRVFSGTIDRQWHISSFSSLFSTYHINADLADRDAISEAESRTERELGKTADQESPKGIFAFPKGTRAGTFMHDIFEHLNFTRMDSPVLQDLVTNRLKAYGFELTWLESLCEMIHKVTSISLDPDIRGFSLSKIRSQDRINELEFYFPLKPISPSKLGELFKTYGAPNIPEGLPERVGQMTFSLLQGFMKGFMDMVFQYENRYYLVDWKSNFLGTRVEDYDQEGVTRAMEEGGYHFQYHLYTVALNQYLKLRLPGYDYEQHFGGVYYIFIRGVDPHRGPHFGIYRHKPSKRLIEALCSHLIG